MSESTTAQRSSPAPGARRTLGLEALVALTFASFAAAFYAIIFVAPVEEQMGVVQKIFYFHVPSAWGMYAGFGACAIGSLIYLIKRQPRFDALAVAGAEVGLLFCAIVLVTGPLWARKAWGIYWTWDPRLTTTLLAGMMFLAYVVLRAFGGSGEAEKKFASGLAIVGLFNLPIIHYSVQRWQGQHPTVITKKGGGLHPDMVPALILGFVAFSLLAVLLMWLRARAEKTRQALEVLELAAAEHGLLEER